MPRVLVSDPIAEEGIARLRQVAEVDVKTGLSPDDLKTIIGNYDALAVRSAERAVSTGQRVELEPMTAVERKVVHLRLKDYPGVTTESEGTEPNRFVVIAPGG